MNSEPIDQSTQYIGQSLLPKGCSLADYIAHVQEGVSAALSNYDIKVNEYLTVWLLSECLNAAGWNTQVKVLYARIDAESSDATQFTNVHYLLLDDHTAVSLEGHLGVETIKSKADENIRNNLRQGRDFKQQFSEENPGFELELLAAKTVWIDEVSKWENLYIEILIDGFHAHPGSRHIAQSVASRLIASRLEEGTNVAARSSIKTRL